jgi:hypothetical protein
VQTTGYRAPRDHNLENFELPIRNLFQQQPSGYHAAPLSRLQTTAYPMVEIPKRIASHRIACSFWNQ